MWALVGMLRRTAMRRGLRGGDSRWLSLWIALAGLGLVRRVASRRPVVEQFELRPGETIMVTDLGIPQQS